MVKRSESTAAAAAGAADDDGAETAPAPSSVALDPPVIRPSDRPRTASASTSSPSSPPLPADSAMVPVADEHELRDETPRSERAQLLRQRDVAEVARLPDFSPEDAEAGGGGEGSGGGGGGSMSTADAAAAAVDAYMDLSGRKAHDVVVVPPSSSSTAAASGAAAAAAATPLHGGGAGCGDGGFSEATDVRRQLSPIAQAADDDDETMTVLSEHPSSIHWGTSTAAPEELALAADEDVPEAATSPRRTLSSTRGRLVDRTVDVSAADSLPARPATAPQRLNTEQRRSVRSSLERFEERRCGNRRNVETTKSRVLLFLFSTRHIFGLC